MVCITNIYFSELELKGTYDIDGQILILPIKGHGATNIKLVGGDFDLTLKWSVHAKNGMNKFLNENSQELSENVEPAVSNTIAVILKSTFAKFSEQIPYNELFG
ncbi:PREDICTED: uncharacterized protein LOC108560802 [Nicrophorus vespilloides]|uniref:Uncharacterized protein LOC108560802 n=1 Tax=Nicrophorus vespilloides TaxID=110193 RepID=A0ABM1MHC5_NICVS|nr:PREDICTED: uncharacterized protein LOC108560802 [Nicrophorus vespilloides]